MVVDISVFHPSVGETVFERRDKSVPKVEFRFACHSGEMSYRDFLKAPSVLK